MTTDPNTLTLLAGKTFRVTFVRKDQNGNPISLAGWGGRFQILQRINGTAWVDVNDTTSDPGEPSDPCVQIEPGGATGNIVVRIGADQTGLITRASAFYDASIYSKSDPTEIQPLASGPLKVLRTGDDGFVAS